MSRRIALIAAAVVLPAAAMAVGPEDDVSPPEPTETTTTCEDGQVWNPETERCIDADDSAFEDTDRIRAIRELAHAGRTDSARAVLATLEAPNSDVAWTYRGFLARADGNWTAARAHYATALSVNPDNLLARSYLGMGYAGVGDLDAARAQLSEIRVRGGRQTWPEVALRLAIEDGASSGY